MKKRSVKAFIALTLLVIGIIAAFSFFVQSEKKGTVYLAVVGPMTGKGKSEGLDMIRGIQLYLDQVNLEGGVNGKNVKLLAFDDKNDKTLAQQRAEEIVAQNKAHVVLGHLYSSTSIKGGEVYKRAGIPAISGSATADSVVEDNDWYFRVIFDNRTQAVFLANYVYKILKQDTVSIIYDTDSYGTSLAEPFRNTFRGLGGTLKFEWHFDTTDENVDQQLENIVIDLVKHKKDNPGLIFLAVHGSEAVKLIVPMKRMGLSYTMIGADSLGGKGFARRFNEFPEEQAEPGYFTDGIYAPSPIIFDVASEKAQQIRNEFITKYGHAPSWKAMTYYDAAMVAIEAMKQAGVKGGRHLAEERQKIRDSLASITHIKNAINGVTGDIYFDYQGNVTKPLAIGIFSKQLLISALTQLQLVNDLTRIQDLEQELKAENIVIVNNNYMHKTKVVYTGIDINEVTNLDIKTSSYTMDFYLWFRYQGQFDETHIEFINSVTPIKLGEPIAERVMDDITYRAYRIKTAFKGSFQFFDYPFDVQELEITFRHPNLTRENLIYVVDEVGMRQISSDAILQKLARAQVFESITEWTVKKASFFQDTLKNESTLGNPQFFLSDANIEYSRFNASLSVERDIFSFIIKNMLPVIILLVLSYTVFFMSPDELTSRVAIGINALLAVAFFHLKMSSGLPGIGYLVALDYSFYAIYVIIVAGLLVTLLSYRWDSKNQETKVKVIILFGKVGYPAVLIIGGILFAHQYGVMKLPSFQLSSLFSEPTSKVVEGATSYQAETKKTQAVTTTLTLNSWDTDTIKEINTILVAFHREHPNIKIKHVPLNWEKYVSTIISNLENGIAGDLLYVQSFSPSRPWFEKGYLEALGDLPGLKDNFQPDIRLAWTSDDGEPYAVPFLAVANAIYYNVDIFKRLRLKPPTTWKKLLNTAKRIKRAGTRAGYVPFANGSGDDWSLIETLFVGLAPNFIGGRDGRLKYLSGERCFDDKHSVAAFQALADLRPFLPPSQETLTYYDSQQLFQTGKAAMWMNASWEVFNVESDAPNLNWSVFAMPAPARQPRYVTFSTESAIALNAASKHKKEARLFLEWLTTPQAAEVIANESPGYFPMHKQPPKIRNEHAKTFLALVNKAVGVDVRWSSPMLGRGLPDGYSLMDNAAKAVLQGEMTPQQAANHLQRGLAEWFEPAQTCPKKSR
ncbi:MAG: hypothetical protein DRR08_07230 [Candidatus Parabeggiatoa sp. nov. 2]|nr:MAG: hypothetical protein B6247_09275 [Beggiatoa sp. 4572_84]RKZ62018.1 MAG: hypothetical protein DRR08_07230 [Gammaproteobacteria bacterium]